MKFLKSTILTFTALAALSLTGCSEEEITYGPVSNGLYFASESAKATVTDDSPFFELTFSRQGITEAAEYPIVFSGDDVDLFDFPATVAFGVGGTEATVTIESLVANMVPGEKYTFSVTYGDGVPECLYGLQDMEVTVVRSKNYTEAQPVGTGTCTWVFTLLFTQPIEWSEMPVEYRTEIDNPTKGEFLFYEFLLRDPEDPVIIQYDENTHYCTIPEGTETGFDYQGEPICVIDSYSFYGRREYLGKSTYNPLTGIFALDLVYYFEQGGSRYYFTNCPGYEYCQVDGFGDYSISISYQGMKTAEYGTAAYALVDYSVGKDTSKTVFLASSTLNETSMMNAILADDPQCITVRNNYDGTVEIPLDGAGTYTVLGVTFDEEGNNMLSSSFTFSTTDGVPENEDIHWPVVGTAIITDGWITANPAFLNEIGKPTAGAAYWEVELRESAEKPGYYRLKNVWTTEECPLVNAELNSNTAPTDIFIDATDPEFVVINIQYSGFTDLSGQPYYIANFAGYYLTQGRTKEQIQATSANCVLKDGVIEIKPSYYGFNDYKVNTNYADNPTSYIELFFDNAVTSAKKKAAKGKSSLVLKDLNFKQYSK